MAEQTVPKALQDSVERMLEVWIGALLPGEGDALAGAKVTHPLPNLFYLRLRSGESYCLRLEVPPVYTLQAQERDETPVPEGLVFQGGTVWMSKDFDEPLQFVPEQEVSDDE